ncbi:fimbria/pilus outer membrane usher protein [Pseudomonas sp. PSKL.D1]|uniref:fimbria/pilus outer membrane usher protein n=1 Tax=Pseudomonas sp. PSKL.D1 TaxID=3029060 RepID=UPI002380DB51|nr:fimbria/pilus outer membrane usher protein [Pseudomonas sp. PSKL.D1]WDY59762.1 fimbrial biogenesis outer membrane usher protein [Pseudomonas sp. PSKL.D1]
MHFKSTRGNSYRYAVAALLGGHLASPVAAVEFDAGSLRDGTSRDLHRFEKEEVVPEGTYTFDVTLNERWIGRHRVPLQAQGHPVAAPCYSEALLKTLGVDLRRLSRETRQQLAREGACAALAVIEPQANETLDFGNLALHLVVPQQALLRLPSGYLPPENWDSGVTAGFFDYRLNLYDQKNLDQGETIRQGYLGVRMGINTGPWYWRHEGGYQVGQTSRYQPMTTSVRRDIPGWSAQLTLGDGYSGAGVFEGSAMRGVLLASDPRMLPEEQRGFAPVVRGVANSVSLLSIRQRGVLLHESTVAPGPFEVDNLYASGLNDDLEVTLREADGRVRTFFLPYGAAPLALRPGVSRFELGSGAWRDALGQTGPGFVQGSWQQGLSNHFSVHGGTWVAEDYLASAMGVAINSAFGAIGLTGFHASAAPAESYQARGQAWRLSWRQRLSATATDLSATLTRSTGPDYYSFNDFARVNAGERVDPLHWQLGLGLEQQLGERAGRFSLSASLRQNHVGSSNKSYTAGYNNHVGALSYGITFSRELRNTGEPFQTVMFNASLPLGERRRSSLSATHSTDSRGQGRSNLRWSGTAGDHGQWGHGLALVRQDGEQASSGYDANVLHRSASGELMASVSGGRGYRQATLGANGALVAHAGGVIAAPPLGESFAIVHAPHADAARIRQHVNVQLDRRGYAVVPALSPYTINTVELDPKGMSRDTELLLAAQSVVPRAGAATLLHYPTRSGREIVLQARLKDGTALPFGAQVLDAQGNELGMVGQGSRLYVRTHDTAGTLRVQWGRGDDEQCVVAYDAGAAATRSALACGG